MTPACDVAPERSAAPLRRPAPFAAEDLDYAPIGLGAAVGLGDLDPARSSRHSSPALAGVTTVRGYRVARVDASAHLLRRLSVAEAERRVQEHHPFYTVGHSTRSVAELAELVRQAGADLIVDTRTIPRSRTNPQFNADTLPDGLATWQVGYRHIRKLGGLRGRRKDQAPSRNTFWENSSFRNYADYAATPDFREGLEELRDLGRTHVCAIMCAEAVWWRCHRRIIADYLLAGGNEVFHVLGPGKIERARMNPAAVHEPGGTLVYPAPQEAPALPRDRRGLTSAG